MYNISKNISYGEATKSQTATRLGLDNNPTEQELRNMQLVADKCFQPLREWYGKAIAITSFFRSAKVNAKIGGSQTSQHCAGGVSGIEEAAIDIDADVFDNGITNKEIFNWLKENVEYDQLIWEYGTSNNPNWVHVSYRKGANRKMNLKVERINGKSKYTVI